MNCIDFFNLPFWQTLIASIIASLIGFGGAYAIYLISIHQIREDRLIYFTRLIKSIIPTLKRQADYCKDAAEKAQKDALEIMLLKIEANNDLTRLADKLDQEGVFHAFLDKYSRNKETYEKFEQIYGCIDFLDRQVNDLVAVHQKTVLGIWERKKDYADTFRQIQEKMQLMIMDAEIRNTYPAYEQFLQDTLTAYSANNPPGENIAYSHNEVCLRVHQYLLQNGPIIPSNTELMFLLNEALNKFAGIEMAGQYAAENYSEIGEALKQKVKSLEKHTAQLQNDFNSNEEEG